MDCDVRTIFAFNQRHDERWRLIMPDSSSDVTAEQSRQALSTTICDRLAKDRDMESRLQSVENKLRLQSNASINYRSNIISTEPPDSDNLTIVPGNPESWTIVPTTASFADLPCCGIPRHEFEEHLNNSWVYRRNQHREENMSFRSSVLRLSAWSVLSDISLANVSVIAVMSLPVQLQELSNGHWYNGTPLEDLDRPQQLVAESPTGVQANPSGLGIAELTGPGERAADESYPAVLTNEDHHNVTHECYAGHLLPPQVAILGGHSEDESNLDDGNALAEDDTLLQLRPAKPRQPTKDVKTLSLLNNEEALPEMEVVYSCKGCGDVSKQFTHVVKWKLNIP